MTDGSPAGTFQRQTGRISPISASIISHPAEKQKYRKVNKDKYIQKQAKLGIQFSNANFFGRFEEDTTCAVIQSVL